MPEYRSKERVVRDEVLVYPEGDLIPESDVEELKRQGFIEDEKAKAPAANKSRSAPANK